MVVVVIELWVPAIIVWVAGVWGLVPCPELAEPEPSFIECKRNNLGNPELLKKLELYQAEYERVQLTCIREGSYIAS